MTKQKTKQFKFTYPPMPSGGGPIVIIRKDNEFGELLFEGPQQEVLKKMAKLPKGGTYHILLKKQGPYTSTMSTKATFLNGGRVACRKWD